MSTGNSPREPAACQVSGTIVTSPRLMGCSARRVTVLPSMGKD